MRFILLFLFVHAQWAGAEAFWWGVGHASFQVEGSPADSDWRRWTETPGHVEDGANAEVATGFWRDPDQDFTLAHKLGANMFRLSLAWERIEPAPGQWDETALKHYESILLKLRAQGIEPLVTLHHFVLPAWLADKGGLEAKDFADHFAQYAHKVVRRLALGPSHVRWWMTFNEPVILVFAGYITGEWPPNLRNYSAAARAEAGLARAHLLAMRAIRADAELPSDLEFSVAAHLRDFQAKDFGPLNHLLAGIAGWLFNRQFLNSILSGRILAWLGGWPVYENVGLPVGGPSLNYLGVNYYGRNVIHLKKTWPFTTMDEGEGAKSDLGWTIYPEGLGHVIQQAYQAYKLPILISENGVADSRDEHRADFLRQHLAQIRAAREMQIPVIGYLHWSLTDNFEWAKGLAPRFGLVEMDYNSLKRKPRPSFYVYRDLIKAAPK